jgi:hypothetical protein
LWKQNKKKFFNGEGREFGGEGKGTRHGTGEGRKDFVLAEIYLQLYIQGHTLFPGSFLKPPGVCTWMGSGPKLFHIEHYRGPASQKANAE